MFFYAGYCVLDAKISMQKHLIKWPVLSAPPVGTTLMTTLGTRGNHAFLSPTMPPQQTTDPAARLIAILDKALTTSPNQSYLHFWATAFDLDVKSVPDI